MRENSDGEKFVIYFSVISALMAYTRSRNLEAVSADAERDSSVLVMDNPFGPSSSEKGTDMNCSPTSVTSNTWL